MRSNSAALLSSPTFYYYNLVSIQIGTYGLVPIGKHRESAEHGSSIPDRMAQDFSSGFRPVSRVFSAGSGEIRFGSDTEIIDLVSINGIVRSI